MPGLASEVITQQEARVIRRIPAGAVLALAMLGVTERGRFGEPVLTQDLPEWQTEFGSFTAESVINEARAFFDNGGTRLWQSRVVHVTDSTDPLTKASAAATLNLLTAVLGATSGTVLGTNAAPFDLEPGDDLDIAIDAGGPVTATFTATPASVTGTTTETFVLADGFTLTWLLDSGLARSVTFLTAEFAAIGAATALEVAAVVNSKAAGISADVNAGALRITSDLRGTDSDLGTFAGTSATVLGINTESDTGTGNVADIDAVTAAEAITVIGTAVGGAGSVTQESGAIRITSATTGGSSDVLVQASSTADDEFGFDNATHIGAAAGAVATLQLDGKTDGDYGNELSIEIAAATSGDADEFNLNVIRSGLTVEKFSNLSMTDADANYVELVINSGVDGQGPSNLIAATDLDVVLPSPSDIPATGTLGPMAGGDDGLGSLVDADYIGGSGVNGEVGLRTFDVTDDLDVLVVPGQATSGIHNAMVTYCDINRGGLLFAVLDPPANQTAAQMVTYVMTTASLFNLTENAAIYWPRVKIANPSATVYGTSETLTVSPCGHIAGIYARTDASKIGGAFEQPGGTENGQPLGVIGFETDEVLKKPKRELVFPANINPISREKGTPIFVDGARNLDITGNWPSVGQRRGVQFVEKRLIPGLAFIRHKNIKTKLYEEGKLTVQSFLLELTQNDAFASKKPSEAFSVDFGPGLNPPSVAASRQVKARIGLATSVPAEFITLIIGPDNQALEEELAALAA